MAETKAHALDGATDPARWLRHETGISAREATRRATLAQGLVTLGDTAGALAQGALTGEHAEVLARAVQRTPQLASHEAALVELASTVAVEELARHVRRLERRVQADQGASAFERQRARRALTCHPDPDGGCTWRLVLDDVDSRTFLGAVDRIAEELWRAAHGQASGSGTHEPDLSRRRADAVVELCRRGVSVTPDDPRVRRPEPLVMVLVDHDTLAAGLRDAGVCELDDGTPLAPATARRLACEARILPVVLDGCGQPLDLGRDQRLASAAQRRALIVRSGGVCEVPGCTRAWSMCDAHHLGPGGWDGGARTRLEELAWVCNEHHHLVHEGGATLTRHRDGAFTLTLPDGCTLTEPTRRRSQPRPRPIRTGPTGPAPPGSARAAG